MIKLSEITKLSTREGKKLDYSKLGDMATPGLEKQKILAFTSDEIRDLLGIEKEYKNLGAYYHLCKKIAQDLKVKTVINRQVVVGNKPVRIIFLSNLDKVAMFNELQKIVG